jgi:DNA-binding MarR family transcriptional regulator
METESDKEEIESPKRLKESQWIVISSLWEMGEVTLKDLSEKFGISEAALSQGLKRRGIKRGAKAHSVYKEVEAKSKEEREKLVEEIYAFKKKFLRYGDFLMTLTMNQIMEAKKGDKSIASCKPEIDAIFAATKVYKTIRNDMFHLYDLYNPDAQPDDHLDFNIGVYSQKELDDLKEAQELYAKEFAELNEDNQDEDKDPEGQDLTNG